MSSVGIRFRRAGSLEWEATIETNTAKARSFFESGGVRKQVFLGVPRSQSVYERTDVRTYIAFAVIPDRDSKPRIPNRGFISQGCGWRYGVVERKQLRCSDNMFWNWSRESPRPS